MAPAKIRLLRFSTLAALVFAASATTYAQKDHGVRPGPPGAGGPVQPLTANELAIFNEGVQRAIQLEAVCDDCTDVTIGAYTDPAKANLRSTTNSSGLGVRFNGDQCTVCHNQPALGGSGGFMVPNPQDPPHQQRRAGKSDVRSDPSSQGRDQHVPSFIQHYGPIREVRFARKAGRQLQTAASISCSPSSAAPTSGSPTLHRRRPAADRLRGRVPARQRALPYSAAALRPRHHRRDPGPRDSGAPRGHRRRFARSSASRACPTAAATTAPSPGSAGRRRTSRSRSSRRRGLQRRDGRHQRRLPAGHRRESRRALLDKSEPNDITRTDPNDARNQSFYNPLHELPDWLEFALFMRFLDAPQPVPVLAQRAARPATLRHRPGESRASAASRATPQRW